MASYFTAAGLKTHIWNNNLRSVVLLVLFPVLLLFLFFGLTVLWTGVTSDTDVVGGLQLAVERLPGAAPFALAGSAAWFGVAWFGHQAMIDRATGARAVTQSEEPVAYRLMENLCISRGMTMPALKVMEVPQMNAFASGLREKNYAVTLTRGLLDNLTEPELEAVIGHELAHIRHKDVRLLVIAVIFVGIFSFFGEMIVRNMFRVNYVRTDNHRRSGGGNAAALIFIAIVIVVIAYLLAVLIRFSLSRRREYMADAGSVEMTKDPDAMIAALNRISGNAYLPNVPADVREMMFENPKIGIAGAFSTHPPIDKRIDALVKYAGGRPPAPGSTPPRMRAAPDGRAQNPWRKPPRRTFGRKRSQ